MVRPVPPSGLGWRRSSAAWWNTPVRGVELVELDRHRDSRGSLLAFGGHPQVPFEVRNAYFILDCPADAVRAEHATSGDTAIVALSSSVRVDVDNGSEQATHELSSADIALLIRAGVWLRLSGFDDRTQLVVLSSQSYSEMTHFDAPQPALLDGR
jgi:hypothetical protein